MAWIAIIAATVRPPVWNNMVVSPRPYVVRDDRHAVNKLAVYAYLASRLIHAAPILNDSIKDSHAAWIECGENWS